MKILLCNIAICETATNYPPIACTSLINFLKRYGYDAEFFDIDFKRPSEKDLREYFHDNAFDLVGISAVVSTGYQYTKNLARIIKEVSPAAQVIVGGNLAAAYKVLLEKCQVDLCVMGEGEKVLLNLVRYLERNKKFSASLRELSIIKGIAFRDPVSGEHVVTAPEDLLDPKDFVQPDYDFLAQRTDIWQYISDPLSRHDFSYDPRSREAHRRGQKMATIFTSKGCVNRCSFCHRWIKGYRVFPLAQVISTIKNLKEKYNVGFFCITEESFGEDYRWLEEFIQAVKPLDILFQIAGVRVSIVKRDPTIISRLKNAGMTALYFGMESGCDKILSIMEKRATREDNLFAARLCNEAGLYTVIQLVIGMPGENDQTINETIDFVEQATAGFPYLPAVSVNHLQALPGTPCYDFLKVHKLIGQTIDDEEQYLLKVSNVNAAEFSQYINVSEAPLSRAYMWHKKIGISSRIAWLKKHEWRFNSDEFAGERQVCRGKSSRIKFYLKTSPMTYRFIDALGDLFYEGVVFQNRKKFYGFWKAIGLTCGLIREPCSNFKVSTESLRRILQLMNEKYCSDNEIRIKERRNCC